MATLVGSSVGVVVDAWYDELRDAYRPGVVRVLLVGESPPDPAAGDRRFFYAPELTKDHLYRGVATAAYGDDSGFDLADKVGNLRRLQADGFWLIDLSDTPVNHLPSPERRRMLRAVVAGLVDRAQAIAPADGVIVCMTPVFKLVAEPLRHAGVRVLHEDPLPFPMPWSRAAFVDGFRRSLTRPG